MSATNRGATRIPQDFYQTPEWCTKALIPLIDWDMVKTFHEPCYGKGAIYELIPLSEDFKSYSEIAMGRDYLTDKVPSVDLIITNPPYKDAEEFIRKALKQAPFVIMLLRLNFMGAEKRFHFWKANPPTAIITLSSRPSFTGGGTDATEYAWFVWGDILKNKTPFQWLFNL